MELVKIDKGYKNQLMGVWTEAFEDEFDGNLCKHFFDHDDLWNYAYGWVDDDRLVSTYLSLGVKVLIRGKEFDAQYIDGIATLPSYRRRGLVQQQMLEDAKRCHDKGVAIMLTDPSRDSFYRNFGFEFALDKYRIRVDKNFCSDEFGDSKCIVKEGSMEHNLELQQSYGLINQWLWENSRYNEMKWPRCYEDIKFKRDDLSLAIAYDENIPKGYIIFETDGKNMMIESLRYVNIDALYALKKYMMFLDDKIDTFVFNNIPENFPLELFLKDLGRPEKKLALYSWKSRMARVVDLKTLLEKLPAHSPTKAISIHVTDEILQQNEGFYTIYSDGTVEKKNRGNADASITITDIVPLLTGLKSAEELYFAGKLSTNSGEEVYQSCGMMPEIIKEIDKLLPKVVTFSAEEYLAP